MALPELLTKKAGPLPVWAWGGLIVGAGVIWAFWRERGTKAPAETLPEGLTPTYVFQTYDQNVTYGEDSPAPLPPVGSRPAPPRLPPQRGEPIPRDPVPAPAPNPLPRWIPRSAGVGPPSGAYVTLAPARPGRTDGAPATLGGLAQQVYGQAGLAKQIWAAPQNARLREKRGDPANIAPGDRVWVPG